MTICRRPGQGGPEGSADDDGTDDRVLAAAIRSAKGNLPDVVRGFVLQSASRIEPVPTRWLWPGRVPLGHLTLLAGDYDAGKSLVTLDMAARVSTGTPWPDRASRKSRDLHPAPRAGQRADLHHARSFGGHTAPAPGTGAGPISIASFLRPASRAPANRRAKSGNGTCVCRTTWNRSPSALRAGACAADCRRSDVGVLLGEPRQRRLSGPALLLVASTSGRLFNVAVVCVTDLRRVSRGGGGYEAGGNRALTAAARAGWAIVRHPREHDKRVLLPLKMNLGAPGAGLEFRIDERGVTWEDQPAKITAEALLAAETSGPSGRSPSTGCGSCSPTAVRPAREILCRRRNAACRSRPCGGPRRNLA